MFRKPGTVLPLRLPPSVDSADISVSAAERSVEVGFGGVSEIGRKWHPEDIKAELRKRFGTQGEFCQCFGVPRDNLAQAIREPYSIPVERAVSLALAVPLHELWPDRWLPDGRPIGRSARRQTGSDLGHVVHRQNEAAS